MDNIWGFFFSIIYIIPFILLYAAGIVFSAMKWKSMPPRVCLFAALGCSLLLINSLIGVLHSAWLFFWFYQGSSRDVQFLGTVTAIEGVIRTIIGIVGFVFLLAAIFVKRDQPPQIQNY